MYHQKKALNNVAEEKKTNFRNAYSEGGARNSRTRKTYAEGGRK